MQLQKQARKAHLPRIRTVKLESFNPAMRPGFEIAAFTTLPYRDNTTRGVIVAKQKE